MAVVTWWGPRRHVVPPPRGATVGTWRLPWGGPGEAAGVAFIALLIGDAGLCERWRSDRREAVAGGIGRRQ